MSTVAQSIDGEPVTTKLAMKMEDSLQAFAVRAACFIGELDVPFSEEFDGHDFGATHIIAYVGDEPVGAVRVRWFQSFAMPERLAVIQRFRGSTLQSAWAISPTLSGPQWLVRTVEQAPEEARRLRRLGGFLGLQPFLFGRRLVLLLGHQPFVQTHACLGRTPRFVGPLAFGKGLFR